MGLISEKQSFVLPSSGELNLIFTTLCVDFTYVLQFHTHTQILHTFLI